MKRIIFLIALLSVCNACIENPIDSQQTFSNDGKRTFKSLMTRSVAPKSIDSLRMISLFQSNFDNMIMNQIIMKDSVLVLAISSEEATDLGIPQEMYNRYVDYVSRLNAEYTYK